MFVLQFKDDLKEALGTCEDDQAYRRLTDAVELLAKSGLFNANVGELSVCVCGNFITLPAEVETPLAITVDARPAIIRNEWFHYHINGPGDTVWTPCNMADVLGSQFCTIRDPDRPVRLVARVQSAKDSNKKLRVFGWAQDGSRILSRDANGQMVDGFFVPLMFGRQLYNVDAPPIVKIERIFKEQTSDIVELFAVDPDTATTISTLGSYRPKEIVPKYLRLRVAARNVVRVKYRRRDFEIRDDYDWIPVDNRLALIHALRAVKFGLDGKYAMAESAEATALRYMRNKQNASRPGGIAPPQVIQNGMPHDSSGISLYY